MYFLQIIFFCTYYRVQAKNTAAKATCNNNVEGGGTAPHILDLFTLMSSL